ncbi:MAG TPA: hypothetical protein VF488_12520 [Gemmatimonadaceae bacterium]
MHARSWLTTSRTLAWGAMLLVTGIALLVGARWFAPIVSAQQAMREGRSRDALDSYRVAEERLGRSFLARRLAPSLYDTALSNELSIMYALKQYDDVIDKAGATQSAAGRFWAGCALFSKADVDVSSKNWMNWMSQAQQEFRAALDADPSDFDARFNYELAGRLILSMKQDPTVERPKDLQLLVPSSAQAPKKVS